MVHARGVHDRGSARRRRPRAPHDVGSGWLRGLGLAAPFALSLAAADPARASARASAHAPEPGDVETDARETTDVDTETREDAVDDAPTTDTETAPRSNAPTVDDAPTLGDAAHDDDAAHDGDDTTNDDDATDDADTDPPAPDAPRPPRIDGVYVGGTLFGGLGLVRVNDFATDGPFAALGGTAGVGQMVFPWLGLGLHGGGGAAVRSEQGARQKLGQGYLGVQFKFVPLPVRRVPLTLLASFGFGGGAVRQAGIAKRSGYGGAQFGAAVRYELFPWAAKRKPFRAGGLALGPELGWIGFTPAATGRPMSNVFYLAIATTYYFGS